MKATCVTWTAEMDDLLQRLIGARYSATAAAAEIVRQLGKPVSRLSAMGRAYRKGWSFNSDHIRNTTFGRVLGREKPSKPLPSPKPEKVAIPEPEAQGPNGDFPSRGTCRWIHGDVRTEWRCCAAPASPGSSYCAHHNERSRNLDGRRDAFVAPKTKLPRWAA